LKSLIKYSILFIILLLSNDLIIAQSISYRSLTTKDGLPSNTVYQIKQDKKGFIWIATANGLARYDGKSIKLYNPTNIKDKDMIGLLVDSNDKVWFWNISGELYYVEKDIIQKKKLEGKKVLNFTQQNSEKYWFISKNDGLYQLLNNGSITCIEKNKNLKRLYVEGDSLLSGYGSEVHIYTNNKRKSVFVVTGKDENKNFIEERFFFKILNKKRYTIQYPQNTISRIDKNGLFVNEPFKKYSSMFSDRIINIYQDKKSNYWITTSQYVFIFDSNYQPLNNKQPILSDEKINDYINDIEGNHWLATKNKGIKIISSINLISDQHNSLENGIYSLSLINDDLLIGLDKGMLTIKNLETNKFSIWKFDSNEPINQINKAANEKIWLSSYTQSVYLSKDYTSFTENIGNRIISYKTIWNRLKNEPLFIGEHGGVLKIPSAEIPFFTQINQTRKEYTWKKLQLLYSVKGINERTYAIEKVKSEYWFGTTDGLYHYKKDSAILTKIPELQNTWITHIINKNDTTWVATQTDGLFQLINKKVIKSYNDNNGLISNNCKTLSIENGVVWVGTNNGINRINLAKNEIELINNLDGLPNNDINALVLDEQNVYIGTSEGLTSFNKNISTKNTTPPPIHLSKFQIFERDTTLSDSYVLNHNDNNIRIGFTGISFRSQGTFKYKYRMLGISDKWIETKTDFASYPILTSGDYTFEAYAINEDGVESENPVRIKIYIKTPFWKTWWFTVLCFSTALTIIWGISWYRFKQIEEKLEREKEFQQQLSELEMQALQAQMNPHFIFNALNAIQHYLTIGEGEDAILYLAKFAKLIRTIFEYSKKQTISLTQEIEFLGLYIGLEKLRFKDKINVEIEIEESIYTDEISLPPLLIQPLIENAFKHGFLHKKGSGNLKINFYTKDNFFKCSIIDDGIGREATQKLKNWKSKIHQSSGLKTTEERLEIWSKHSNFNDNDLENINLFKITDLKDGEKALGTRIDITFGKYYLEE